MTVRAVDIPDRDIVEHAIAMSARPHPSDLIRWIAEKYGCSINVAGKAYSRVLEQGKIKQGSYDINGQVRWYWEEIT